MEENKAEGLHQDEAQHPIPSDELSLILKDLPEEKQKAIEQVIQLRVVQMEEQRISSFSGPIPHPEHFARYEETLPGAADRILTLAEKEQEARHELEKKESSLWKWGLWAGASLILVLMWTFAYLAIELRDGQIFGWFGTAVLIIAVVFVLRIKPWK